MELKENKVKLIIISFLFIGMLGFYATHINSIGVQNLVTMPAMTSIERNGTIFLKLPMETLFCPSSSCKTKQDVKWKMVFLVKSAAGNTLARKTIRRTWASVSYIKGFQLRFIFIVGLTDVKQQALIEKESEKHGDILQLDMADEYRFIAKKTLSGMQWVTESLPDDVFYTSCDDDFMIDMVGLVDVIRLMQQKVKNEDWIDFPIICSYEPRIADKPIRRKDSKYRVSKTEYKWPYYPDYCLGGAYTTTVGVIRQLWEAAHGVVPLKMDDVYITGILREEIGMPRQYIQNLQKAVATHHYGTIKSKSQQMLKEWETLKIKFSSLNSCTCSTS